MRSETSTRNGAKLKTLSVVLLSCFVGLAVNAQPEKSSQVVGINFKDTISKKMNVEIWSDVMCPFCYIGKRKFENALSQFPHKEDIQVTWRSFQLDPDMKTDPGKNVNQYLAERKGWTLDYTRQMNDHVTKMAAEVGLKYDFDKAVVANSFDAHRLSHLATKYGLGEQMEERLFKAYFTEGKNTADHATLIELGKEVGLKEDEVRSMLNSNQFADEVNMDIYHAQQVGARGVPFFVLDNKYAVSGAQQPETFLMALNKSWEEWKAKSPLSTTPLNTDGPVCTPDGECE